MEKTAAANIKHCYLGSVLAMIASANLSTEDIKKQFTFKQESPFVEVKVIDTWKPTFDVLEEWIQTYIEKV